MLQVAVEVNKEDKKKETPLLLAAQHGHKDIALFLLNAGADPLAANEQGKTARDIARFNEKTEIAELLDKKELENAIARSLEPKVRALIAGRD